MKEKQEEVINTRLPAGMKDKLKSKYGNNMSKIMREHFQKLLDIKDYENRNSCWGCKKLKKYNECSFVTLSDEDGSCEVFIFCNDCMKAEAPSILDTEQEQAIYNSLKDMAFENKHPEHLEELSNIANKYTHYCEVGVGTLYFKKEFNAKMEEYRNGNSTQTHNTDTPNLTFTGYDTQKEGNKLEEEYNGI